MTFFIGLDEAGLGPNLGPLVVAASVWRSRDSATSREPSSPVVRKEALTRLALCADLNRNSNEDSNRTVTATNLPRFADSKTLYHSGGSLAALEQGVWCAYGQFSQVPRHWREIWEKLAPSSERPWEATPEVAHFDGAVLAEIPPESLGEVIGRFGTTLASLALEVTAMRADVVFPQRFNRLLDTCRSKGELLSGVTLRLLRDLIATLPEEPLVVRCDKHGGRNFYQPLLQQFFPDALVEVWHESRELSRYRWGPAERRVEIEFAPRGESFVPTALASMTAKYLRERAMEPFNVFWQNEVPGLKPTAGYPVDARRFWRETAAARERLQLPDDLLWRKR